MPEGYKPPQEYSLIKAADRAGCPAWVMEDAPVRWREMYLLVARAESKAEKARNKNP